MTLAVKSKLLKNFPGSFKLLGDYCRSLNLLNAVEVRVELERSELMQV